MVTFIHNELISVTNFHTEIVFFSVNMETPASPDGGVLAYSQWYRNIFTRLSERDSVNYDSI